MQKMKTSIRAFLSVFFIFSVSLVFAESCSLVGSTQNKYMASGCSYTTQTRKCCPTKQWSAWGGTCPKNLTAVSSSITLKLACMGTSYYYVSFGNGMDSGQYDPYFQLPYAKCPSTNICSGKSEGYICYKSYSAPKANSQCYDREDCRYWSESGTTDQSEECYWGGEADVTISINTCKYQ